MVFHIRLRLFRSSKMDKGRKDRKVHMGHMGIHWRGRGLKVAGLLGRGQMLLGSLVCSYLKLGMVCWKYVLGGMVYLYLVLICN